MWSGQFHGIALQKEPPVPKMIAAPFWERDVPSGIVNEEMSRDTPISSEVSSFKHHNPLSHVLS